MGGRTWEDTLHSRHLPAITKVPTVSKYLEHDSALVTVNYKLTSNDFDVL